MRLNVFTVYMPFSAYVMRAIDMFFNKMPLAYLLTYDSLHVVRLVAFILDGFLGGGGVAWA